MAEFKVMKEKGTARCMFCGLSTIDEYLYGEKYKLQRIVVHYFCVLLASDLEQNGKDEEGIYGFLPDDIKKLANKVKNSKCSYCARSKATVKCAFKGCRVNFHLPCGIKNGSLHQFFGRFKSYCCNHRPRQRISPDIYNKAKNEQTMCVICYDQVSVQNYREVIWAPCCKKNAFFHRTCIQKLAISFGGYTFKCPLCNDNNEFVRVVKQYGIYVPDRDASWEREENAFHELLQRHNRCDAVHCLCPNGRTYSVSTSIKWALHLCSSCGSQGTHRACLKKKWISRWECATCASMLQNAAASSFRPREQRTVVARSSRPSCSFSKPCRKQKKENIPKDREDDDVDDDDDEDLEEEIGGLCIPMRKGAYGMSKKEDLSAYNFSSPSQSPTSELECSNSPKPGNASPTNLSLASSSSSASVVSIAKSLSPIIIIDSSDESDLEIIADFSLDTIPVKKDVCQREILHIDKENEKEEKRVKVLDDQIKSHVLMCDVGLKLTTSASEESECPQKRRRIAMVPPVATITSYTPTVRPPSPEILDMVIPICRGQESPQIPSRVSQTVITHIPTVTERTITPTVHRPQIIINYNRDVSLQTPHQNETQQMAERFNATLFSNKQNCESAANNVKRIAPRHCYNFRNVKIRFPNIRPRINRPFRNYNFKLKKLSIILEPIMLKIVDMGSCVTVKVVQKRTTKKILKTVIKHEPISVSKPVSPAKPISPYDPNSSSKPISPYDPNSSSKPISPSKTISQSKPLRDITQLFL